MKRMATMAAALLTLQGCGSSDSASFMIDGNETAVTLERLKPWAWSEGWELNLTVRRNPECQRRHGLKVAMGEAPKVELFTPEPYVFIIRQGKRWYVTDLKSCRLQAFKEAPPEPGAPVGAFQVKDDKLVFVQDARPRQAPAAAQPAAAGQPAAQ